MHALASVSGAALPVADGALDSGSADRDGARASVPIDRFLGALAARMEHRGGPDRAVDAVLAETTLGGFSTAIGRTGRAGRTTTCAVCPSGTCR